MFNNNNNNNNNKNNNKEYMKVNSVDISGVKDYENGCRFNLKLNGVMIYGCWLRQTKTGDIFISLPQQQGQNGKWYSIVYAALSPQDSEEIIAEVIRIAKNG